MSLSVSYVIFLEVSIILSLAQYASSSETPDSRL